ncbi:MAG TPA: hypothetical protein VFG19_08325 [Geobacteraceae bacterium]|nr:hypothetical protein [Geobacteraceae bacterium]
MRSSSQGTPAWGQAHPFPSAVLVEASLAMTSLTTSVPVGIDGIASRI